MNEKQVIAQKIIADAHENAQKIALDAEKKAESVIAQAKAIAKEQIDGAVALARERSIDPEIIDAIGIVNGVDKRFLDRAYGIITSYGSIEAFFKNALDIDEKYINEFRQNYLE